MTKIYEKLAYFAIEQNILRPDSLVYGLGLPFMAYQDQVSCYKPEEGWYVVDGLGYLSEASMRSAGVTMRYINHASVLPARCFSDYADRCDAL